MSLLTRLGARRSGALLSSKVAQNVVWASAAFILPIVVAVVLFRAYNWDMSIAWDYTNFDAIWHLVQTKGVLENGWVFDNKYLSAPGIAHWQYHNGPQSSAIHSVNMLVIGWFVKNSVRVQQLYYFMNFGLIALAYFLVATTIGLSRIVALTMAIIFALSPFRFIGEPFAHLVNYFCIPPACLVIYWTATGAFSQRTDTSAENVSRRSSWRWQHAITALVMTLLVAVSDGYYAFFTVLLLAGSVGIRILSAHDWRRCRADVLTATGLVVAILGVNVLLSLPLNQYRHNHPNEFNPGGSSEVSLRRSPAEAEVYSTSIKLAIAPMLFHRSETMKNIGQALVDSSNFSRLFKLTTPVVSLGLVGTFGLLLAGAAGVAPGSRLSFRTATLLGLGLLAMLFSVFGGLGTLVAFLFPAIRAYDRMPLFTICFVTLGLGSILSTSFSGFKAWAKYPCCLALLALALWDQTPSRFFSTEGPLQAKFRSDREFVGNVEKSLPPGSMVFQVPYGQYLGNNQYYSGGAAAFMRFYLHSHTLRWSTGGSINSPSDNWSKATASLLPEDLIKTASMFGFAGVLIDQGAMTPAEATQLTTVARDVFHLDVIESAEAKLAFFKLPDAAISLVFDKNFSTLQKIDYHMPQEDDYAILPPYIDREKLKMIISSGDGSGSVRISDEPGLFNDQAFRLADQGTNTYLAREDVKGDVNCVNFDPSTKVLTIDVKNGSPVDWNLNMGSRPISIGMHVRNVDGSIKEWNGSAAASPIATIPSHGSAQVKLNVVLPAGVGPKGDDVIAEYELLQAGNAWFGMNQGSTCRVQVKVE